MSEPGGHKEVSEPAARQQSTVRDFIPGRYLHYRSAGSRALDCEPLGDHDVRPLPRDWENLLDRCDAEPGDARQHHSRRYRTSHQQAMPSTTHAAHVGRGGTTLAAAAPPLLKSSYLGLARDSPFPPHPPCAPPCNSPHPPSHSHRPPTLQALADDLYRGAPAASAARLEARRAALMQYAASRGLDLSAPAHSKHAQGGRALSSLGHLDPWDGPAPSSAAAAYTLASAPPPPRRTAASQPSPSHHLAHSTPSQSKHAEGARALPTHLTPTLLDPRAWRAPSSAAARHTQAPAPSPQDPWPLSAAYPDPSPLTADTQPSLFDVPAPLSSTKLMWPGGTEQRTSSAAAQGRKHKRPAQVTPLSMGLRMGEQRMEKRSRMQGHIFTPGPLVTQLPSQQAMLSQVHAHLVVHRSRYGVIVVRGHPQFHQLACELDELEVQLTRQGYCSVRRAAGFENALLPRSWKSVRSSILRWIGFLAVALLIPVTHLTLAQYIISHHHFFTFLSFLRARQLGGSGEMRKQVQVARRVVLWLSLTRPHMTWAAWARDTLAPHLGAVHTGLYREHAQHLRVKLINKRTSNFLEQQPYHQTSGSTGEWDQDSSESSMGQEGEEGEGAGPPVRTGGGSGISSRGVGHGALGLLGLRARMPVAPPLHAQPTSHAEAASTRPMRGGSSAAGARGGLGAEQPASPSSSVSSSSDGDSSTHSGVSSGATSSVSASDGGSGSVSSRGTGRAVLDGDTSSVSSGSASMSEGHTESHTSEASSSARSSGMSESTESESESGMPDAHPLPHTQRTLSRVGLPMPTPGELLVYQKSEVEAALQLANWELRQRGPDPERRARARLSMDAVRRVRDACMLCMLYGHVSLAIRATHVCTVKSSCHAAAACTVISCPAVIHGGPTASDTCRGNRFQQVQPAAQLTPTAHTSRSSTRYEYLPSIDGRSFQIVLPHHKTEARGGPGMVMSVLDPSFTQLLLVYERNCRPAIVEAARAAAAEVYTVPHQQFLTDEGEAFTEGGSLVHWWKRLHDKGASWPFITLHQLRHVFSGDRSLNPTVPGPSNEAAAFSMGHTVRQMLGTYSRQHRQQQLEHEAVQGLQAYRAATLAAAQAERGAATSGPQHKRAKH